jgi:hypothetical protein
MSSWDVVRGAQMLNAEDGTPGTEGTWKESVASVKNLTTTKKK